MDNLGLKEEEASGVSRLRNSQGLDTIKPKAWPGKHHCRNYQEYILKLNGTTSLDQMSDNELGSGVAINKVGAE